MRLLLGFYALALVISINLLFQEKTLEQSKKDGNEIYQDFCVQCHLNKGQGVSGVFPPLSDSDYLLNDIDRSIAAIKYGLKGPITVNDDDYDGVMASQGLDDEEIADVMNFILGSWENESDEFITTKRVTSITKKN